jgi:CTP:molybdopterin cytidylyltransferase MocA
LLKRFCSAIQEFTPVELVIVTGFYADAIEKEIANIQKDFPIGITVTRNPSPESGQASSVRLGLESLQKIFDVLLVALSDQPNIGPLEINALLSEYQLKNSEQEIILPVVHGQRGNPVLFSAQAIQKILQDQSMVCRTYMDQHPERVRMMNTATEAYISDVDTVADIQRERLQLP